MRKKTNDKELLFVKTAKDLFIKQGIGSTSMESIATEAGASKATLYSYFPSKESLFEAVVNEAAIGARESFAFANKTENLVEALHRLGMAYLELMTRPDIIAVNRLIISESGRQPELTRIFYENGPRNIHLSICKTLQIFINKKIIDIADVQQAGIYFKAMCDAELVERQLWGLDDAPTSNKCKNSVENAVKFFLAAFSLSHIIKVNNN